MHDEAAELKRELAAHRRRSGSRRARTPPPLKERILSFAERARAVGWTWQTTAEAVGMCRKTLDTWRRAAREGERATRMMPVEVIDEMPVGAVRPPRALTLISPDGWRIEGADIETTLELLRRLS